MNCLCCGKPLSANEEKNEWHNRCLLRFFGEKTLPELQLNRDVFEALAIEATSKGLTVPGVQKKLSLHLLSDDQHPRLTMVDYPTGYILKPQESQFEALPEAEHLVMTMARYVGIMTVDHALVRNRNEYAYITKRVDRYFAPDGTVIKYAMEDFCQIGQRLTRDKYRGSYEKCAKIIQRHSSRSRLDLTEFFLRIIFCYVIGNSDMHLKNFSLIEKKPNTGEYILSPAYDLLPVNCIMPEDKEETALALNGKKINIRKKDFYQLADHCGLTKQVAERLIHQVIKNEDKLYQLCDESLMPDDLKDSLHCLMQTRMNVLR